MDLYWLHCEGPDGPCVLLASYCTRTGTYDLVDDGRSFVSPTETPEGTFVHKWKLIHREPIERPTFRRTP